jgi:hypothetical protein
MGQSPVSPAVCGGVAIGEMVSKALKFMGFGEFHRVDVTRIRGFGGEEGEGEAN